MISKNGRIPDTFVRAMSRILLSLGISVPNFDLTRSPRINIVFTNFSENEIL